jgi:hypothetical protein
MSDSMTFIRLPQALRKEAEKAAAQEERSLSTMLRILIKEALQARNGKGK